MPMTEHLTKFREAPLPPSLRALADSLAQAQRTLDQNRAAGADAGRIEKLRDEALREAEAVVARHHESVRSFPLARVAAIEREYSRTLSAREGEAHRNAVERLGDDLALTSTSKLADLARDVAKGKLPHENFTRSHVALVAREARARLLDDLSDKIGERFPSDLEPWRVDGRWQQATAELEAAEKLTGDPRQVHVADGKGGTTAYKLDDLLT